MKSNKSFLLLIILLFFIIACTKQETQQTGEVVDMKIISSAFAQNSPIPSEFTCDEHNTSPPLMISDVPSNVKSLALIMDDPDAPIGTFVHWVAWNIPTSTKQINKGNEPEGAAGKNGAGKTGYIGPCPPSGTHRYFFKLYALDTTLNIPEGSNKKDLESAMQGHIIAKAELMGTYKRK